MHGYDTFDYFEIDRRLGDVKLFKQIVKELHETTSKSCWTVFNHTGKGHFVSGLDGGASDSGCQLVPRACAGGLRGLVRRQNRVFLLVRLLEGHFVLPSRTWTSPLRATTSSISPSFARGG